MFDQLDEQLHAGSTNYFFVGANRLATINTYGVCAIFFIAPLLGFASLRRYDAVPEVQQTNSYSLIIVILTYIFGVSTYFIFTILMSFEEKICYPFEQLKSAAQNSLVSTTTYNLLKSLAFASCIIFVLYNLMTILLRQST
jgi:hypothetical protein